MTVNPTPGYVQTNAVNFYNLVVTSCPNWGIYWKGGSLLSFHGLIMENNGTVGTSGTGALYYKPPIDGVGLAIDDLWMEANKYQDILIDEPVGADQYNIIKNAQMAVNTDLVYGIHIVGTSLTNNLVCDMVRFYDDAATLDFFADGTSSTIYLDQCKGTSGGTGTIVNEDSGGPLADHDHSGDAGDGGTFDAANLTSGASNDGQVLTSDGSGGAAWENPGAAAGQYRQWLYSASGGDLTILTDVDGNPLMGLCDLE
jgi:hypothetical protein